jgi:hypothetical protein
VASVLTNQILDHCIRRHWVHLHPQTDSKVDFPLKISCGAEQSGAER